MKKEINEITMIDAACDALSYGRAAYIMEDPSGSLSISQDENGHIIAKITAHKQFVLIDQSYYWAVQPKKIRDIHMNRRIKPWPRNPEQ